MTIPILFDRSRLRQRQSRANASHFLREEAVRQAEEARAHIHRHFPRVLTLGSALPVCTGTQAQYCATLTVREETQLVADEEWLPIAPASLDACISVWGLHWVNDVPGVLRQIHHALATDGLFVGITLGAETLRELRHCLAAAETDITGGLSPRIAPFADVREAGALLQRCGFAMPVASSEMVTLSYATLSALMHDLRAIGETSVLHAAQKAFTRRSIFARAAEYYNAYRDDEGRLPASIEFVTLTGWKAA